MNEVEVLRTVAARHTVDDLVPTFARRYGIGGLHLVKVLPVTGRNVNLVLADAREVRYVARCYLRNPGLERIDFQLAFQDHLHKAGIPVPAIIPTATADRVVTIARASWVMFEHIDGTSYDPSDERELRSAARSLNQFHEAGRTFGVSVDDDTIPNLRQWWAHGRDEIRQLQTMFACRDVGAELDFLTAWQERLTDQFPLQLLDRLPTAWLHSDYHGDNLAFTDGEVVGIFDFDVVHHGWRLDDIARAVYYFAREVGHNDRIRTRQAEAFLDSFGLTEFEHAALPAFIVAVRARTAARYRIREREGSDPANALRQHVARMRQLQAQTG